MNCKVISFCTLMVFVSGIAQVAQDSTAVALNEVVVSASSKFNLPRKDSGKPVIKITKKDIESQSAASLADLLNQYAGIEMNGARSNAGQNLGYYIRGGSTRQVTFLINGAQVSDASNISSEFDLRLIDLNQIEEIEILKGAASTLYGANASTAVINIKLKENHSDKLNVVVSSFLATNTSAERGVNGIDDFNNSVQLQGSFNNQWNYGVGFNHQSTDGLSAVESSDEDSYNESDAFNRINLLGRVAYNNHKDFKLSSYLSFDEFKSEFDDFTYIDADNETYNRQLRWGTTMNWNYSEKGEIVYTDVSTHTRRDTRSGFPSIYNADGYSLDVYNKYTFTLNDVSSLRTILGFNFRTDRYEDFSVPFGGANFEQNTRKEDVNAQIYDPYMNVVYTSGMGLNVNAGMRYNVHSSYDSHLVYNINPSYRYHIGTSTLKAYASYSTAYITPSLFQLYAADFGNENLKPEENTTLEAGIEFTAAKSSIGISVFKRHEDHLVQFVTIDPANFISEYQNVEEELIAQGIEVMGQTELYERLFLTTNYTFTEREDVDVLRRIPKHKVNATMRYKAMERGFVTLRYQYNDARADSFFNNSTFTTDTVSLDSYQTLDIDMSYQLKNRPLMLFAGVYNITNTDFTEIYRYQTRGRNYKIGVRYGF